MRKLLMHISYLGTNYKGLQLLNARRLDGKTVVPEYDTIQGVLEQALRKVLQLDDVAVHNSSRTDAGVHSVSSTLQFEINEDDFVVYPYSPERICMSLNYYLEKNQTDIRVHRIAEVPFEFNCRHAYSRTYNYRVAIVKTNDFDNCLSLAKLSACLPITELYRAQVVAQPFDVSAVQQACRIFLGRWNFRSFASLTSATIKGRSSKSSDIRPITEEDLTKTIYRFSFSSSNIVDKDFEAVGYYHRDPSYNKLDFYDFHIEGSGFLRRQVRRMVGVLLGIGRGVIDGNIILQMLKNPSEKNWPSAVSATLSEGLFLKSVNYKSVDIIRGPLS